MGRCGVLIHHGRSLGTAVANRAVEILGVDVMVAGNAFECDAATHRLGGVISHVFIVVLTSCRGLGQEVCNFRAENAVANGTQR